MSLLKQPQGVLRNILVTGGVGFIGSHTVLRLLEHGYEVTIIDNLDNSVEGAYRRMQELAGRNSSRMKFVKGDIRNFKDIDDLFCGTKFHAIVHFAGKKAVGQSVRFPMLYYTHNVVGTANLIEAMRKHNTKTIVFSSSSTVYGNPIKVPITEEHPLKPLSPYGRSKLIIEDMFQDVAAAEPGWRIMLLRYFNPIGAHPSGKLGEHPVGVPNNLVPWLQKVALGQCEALSVYGNDYPTRDGTCIRDYTHVMDIVQGHIAALEKLFCNPDIGCIPINLGRGSGTTVLELIKAFEEASGEKVAYEMKARRPGDSIAVWAATGKAESELGWKASHNLDDMCRDRWRWACANPEGYDTAVAACTISANAQTEDKVK